MLPVKKFGAIAGFLAPMLAFVFVSLAIVSYPQFSWVDNALSDLGVVPGVTSILFTVGIIGAGVCAFLFSILGLYSFAQKRTLGKVGAILFAAATIALVCIGIFNESFRPTHYLVSVAFFVFAPVAFFVLTSNFFRLGKRRLAVFTGVIALFAALTWILQLLIQYVPNVAIPEAASAAAISIWVITLSAKIRNEV